MFISRAEYVRLPTEHILQGIRPDLMRLSVAPPLDVLIDFAIDVANTEKATRNPAEAIIKKRLEVVDFEVDEDYGIALRLLAQLTHQLKDLFLTFDLYGIDGVDYRFWRTVNDDCILQHIKSQEGTPGSVHRGADLPHY